MNTSDPSASAPNTSSSPIPTGRPFPANSYTSDEIDLVEVGAALWRRWKLMTIVFFSCIGLGLAFAFILPKSYSYTAILRLGSYSKRDGTIAPVVSPSSAVAALNQGFINIALQRYAADHPVNPRQIEIQASSPSGEPGTTGNTVTLSGKAPLSLGKAYKSIETNAFNLFSKSTQAQINVIRSNLDHSLTEAQLKLDHIEDPKQIQIEKSGLQQNVSSAKNSLEYLEEQYAVLKDKRTRLGDAGKLYKQQEHQLNAYLDQARKASLTSSKANSPTQAMTALLLNNQIQQNLQQLNGIEQKLTVTLPQQIASVEANMEHIKQQQSIKKTTIERAEVKLANFSAEHKRQVEAQKSRIANLKTRINNIQATQLIVQPSRSTEPVGLSRAVIAILSALFGVILALISAAATNFICAVRTRLRSDQVPRSLKTEH